MSHCIIGSMKACPFCAEKIQYDAVKCKHCGEMISEKPRQEPATGLWGYLGQKAKKNLDQFESNTENRKKQRQAGLRALKERATKEMGKFEANAPSRKKRWQKIIKPPSFLDYLVGLLILIIIVVCYFTFKASFYLFGIKLLKALGF